MKPTDGQNADGAARLLDALRQPDQPSCDAAELLIGRLVEAEAMGRDVDDDPAFAPILRHLDHCAECLALYESVAEDYAAARSEQRHAAGRPAPMASFPKAMADRRSVRSPRSFEVFVRPSQQRGYAVREQPAPYGDPSDEPRVAVEPTPHDNTRVRVVVTAPRSGTLWLVSLTADEYTAQAVADADGLAVFQSVPAGATLRIVGEAMER